MIDIAKMQHRAHLAYQRAELRKQRDAVAAKLLDCSEVRGCKVRDIPQQPFQLHWFTGLRPNFYRAYMDTVLFMQR